MLLFYNIYSEGVESIVDSVYIRLDLLLSTIYYLLSIMIIIIITLTCQWDFYD
jgi:hypothetical protein